MQGKLFFFALIAIVLMASCKGMYDSLDEYSGEVVYPAKYDTIVGQIGYERVEINLMKAGRIPSSRINMGKAKKTIVEYDGKVVTIDSLVSWVNITGLNEPKLYRFRIYTIDEFENKSVPQEIALIPFTAGDIPNVAINAPRILTSRTSAVVDWPSGLSSVLLDYISLTFKYTDNDGVEQSGERQQNPRFFMSNLQPGAPTKVQITYRVVPKINNQLTLDTISLVRELSITGSETFSPVERAILETNGVTAFTADGVSQFTKLVYPLHTNSLQDLFYFSNLKELDLTGGTLFEMRTLRYDRNSAQSTIGGGDFPPFVRKVGSISAGNAQTLMDMLESGLLERVRYRPNSMGLDAMLQPYVASGVVELVDLPGESLIPHRFLVDGVVQDGNWRMDVVRNPTDAPAGTGLENILKTTLRARSASFVFSLPTEYQFNIHEYRYLKLKVYAPAKTSFEGIYAPYQRLWPRFMNYMWAFTNESTFGQGYWAPNADNFRIPDANLQQWHDVTIDLSEALSRNNRVIVLNIGGEPSLTFAPESDIVYYFANVRFAKSN